MSEPTFEPPTPNLPLLRKVLDHIDAHPEEYEQRAWVAPALCGTAYCVAGTALVMTGHTLTACLPNWFALDDEEQPMPWDYVPILDGNDATVPHDVSVAAQTELGLTDLEALALFSEGNNRADVQRMAEQIAARAGERL